VRIVIADSGRATRPQERRDAPAEVIARLSGRRRHGHGLTVVRQVAAAHQGRFALRRSERGSLALFELPLASGRDALVA
jgi:signal transduction histidine kinase